MAVRSNSAALNSAGKPSDSSRPALSLASDVLPYSPMNEEQSSQALAESFQEQKYMDRLANQKALSALPSTSAVAPRNLAEPEEALFQESDLALDDEDDDEAYDYYAYRRQRQSLKAKAADRTLDLALSPVNTTASELLLQSWLNLLNSFGLTLIWINVHAFCNAVAGDRFFPPLGSEWTNSASLGTAISLGGSEAKEQAKQATRIIGTWEVAILIALDLLVLLVLLGILTFIAIIVYAAVDPLGMLISWFSS